MHVAPFTPATISSPSASARIANIPNPPAYKGFDTGNGDYEINTTVWEAIGAATAAGGSTIPTAFGARPPDVSKDRTACTADTWSFWLLYIGPVLLHNN
ncbi:hypothetical protein B0H16DRAFT_1718441 [Mycena metata]|uniref:Uncharacterized protein n=1 Tax=Mycena metata TaxID=1033252 RepID=A0AAD7JFN3_9AGAR|nr:hypothetical protein B0H16DRAFT_1718441 [Mycena metata]